jgi:hypothetical protein
VTVATGPCTVATVRRLLDEDAGVVAPVPALSWGEHTSLAELGLVGYPLFVLVAALEDRYGIELPTELLAALDTVGDVVSFTNANVANSIGGRGHARG